MTPDEGYQVAYIDISDTEDTIEYTSSATEAGYAYTFDMPEDNVYVEAMFVRAISGSDDLKSALEDEDISQLMITEDCEIGEKRTIVSNRVDQRFFRISIDCSQGETKNTEIYQI